MNILWKIYQELKAGIVPSIFLILISMLRNKHGSDCWYGLFSFKPSSKFLLTFCQNKHCILWMCRINNNNSAICVVLYEFFCDYLLLCVVLVVICGFLCTNVIFFANSHQTDISYHWQNVIKCCYIVIYIMATCPVTAEISSKILRKPWMDYLLAYCRFALLGPYACRSCQYSPMTVIGIH